MSPKTPPEKPERALKSTPKKPLKRKPSSTKKAPELLPQATDEAPAEPLLPLGEAGRILWDTVADDLALEDRERALLTLAADQFEELELLKAKIREEGVEGEGYKGQARTSPHAVEARQQRLAIARLLGMIAIPAESGEEKPMTETSRRAQHAARARYMKEADLLAKRKRKRGDDGAA
jgi:hypothetical protein